MELPLAWFQQFSERLTIEMICVLVVLVAKLISAHQSTYSDVIHPGRKKTPS